MNKSIFSQAGLRAIPDPMAVIFVQAGAKAAQLAEQGKDFVSLAMGAPDPAMLPADMYKNLTNQALTDFGPGVLNYTMPQGLPPTRAAFQQFLSKQGVVCTADNMLVTSGGMEALSMGAWLTLNPGDTVIAEGPGFAGVLSVFELLGANVVQIDCGPDGLQPDDLEQAIKQHQPKLISLMPDYQNPTGAQMPLQNRQKIAELLKKYDLLALEDAAYSQLCFEGEILPPIQSFAPDNVIFATSVSKILGPAMRIGVLIAPKQITAKAGDIKSAYNMQASAIHQAITASFLAKSDDHIKKLRSTYHTRRDAMLTALQKHFPKDSGYSWTTPKGGMFIWLNGPSGTDFSKTFEVALQNGVSYIPGSKFYTAKAAKHSSARLNFASTPPEKIAEGIRRLAISLGL